MNTVPVYTRLIESSDSFFAFSLFRFFLFGRTFSSYYRPTLCCAALVFRLIRYGKLDKSE